MDAQCIDTFASWFAHHMSNLEGADGSELRRQPLPPAAHCSDVDVTAEPLLPRRLAASPPRCLTASLPRCLAASLPR